MGRTEMDNWKCTKCGCDTRSLSKIGIGEHEYFLCEECVANMLMEFSVLLTDLECCGTCKWWRQSYGGDVYKCEHGMLDLTNHEANKRRIASKDRAFDCDLWERMGKITGDKEIL